MPHPARRSGRSLQYGCTPINCELRFAVENNEHLLTLVVEVGAYPAFRLKHASVHEEQVRVQRVAIQQSHEVHLSGPCMHRPMGRVLRRIRMSDALGQRLSGYKWNDG